MSLSGLTAVFAAVGLTVLATLFVVFLPKFLFGRLVVNEMLAVRDELDDEILDGKLSLKDPAVRQLLSRINHAVNNHEALSMTQLLPFALRVRKRPDFVAALRDSEFSLKKSDDADTDKAIRGYDDRMADLAMIHAVVSSWFGIFATLGVLAWFAVKYWAARGGPVASVRRFGHRTSSAYLSIDDPDLPHVAPTG